MSIVEATVTVPHDQGGGKGKKASKPALAFSVENFPNPANPSTTIRYSLPEDADVRLVIYNLLGQEIRQLVNQIQSAGIYTLQWDGLDASGRQVTSGVYLYRLEAGQNQAARKLILLK